jgi:LCP family protein required for cell wall assembly
MTDRPRAGHPALAAALSFLFPGLGQAYAGQGLLAAILATPVLLLAVIVIVALSFGTDSLRNQALSSSFLVGLLVLDVALALWRLFAIAQAGFAQAWLAQPTGRGPAISGTAGIGQVGPGVVAVTGPGAAAVTVSHGEGDRARRAVTLSFVVLLMALTLAMHAYLFLVVRELNTTLGQVFDVGKPPTANSTTAPINQPDYHWNGTERINLLLLGIDSGPGRQEALSDTILVVSVDPVARTAALISIPRDTGFVPLPDRHVFADGRYPQKINQLASDAAANPALWCPDLTDAHTCGIRSLERSVGLYLGIQLQYYAQVDLAGFAKLIDALGGVRLCLDGDLIDPTYTDPARPRRMGITLAAGCRRYSGTDALAFARIRKGYLQLPDGTQQAQNDFKRAERQQEVLLALRSEFAAGDVIFQLPGILSAIGQTVATDFPRDKVGDLATLLPLITGPDIERVVLGYPEYVAEPTDPEVNYLLRPKRSAVRAEMTRLFGDDLEGWYLGSTAAGPPHLSASPSEQP